MTSYEQLIQLIGNKKITITHIFSIPRVGGTTLGRALLNGDVGNSVSVFFNEPGNLGSLAYCPYSATNNPRDSEQIYKLILIACRLEILKLQLAKINSGLYPEVVNFREQVDALVIKLNAHRASIKELVDEQGAVIPGRVEQYNEGINRATVELDEKVSKFLNVNKLSGAEDLPPISLILKDHGYNFNNPDFSERLNLIRKSNGNVIFMLRNPWENCASMLYRRTVHFLAEEGHIANSEIREFVETFFYSEKEFTQQDINKYFEKRFKSGDRLSTQKLLEFIGKKTEAEDKSYQVTAADMRKLASEMIAHCKKMFEVSWDNFSEFYSQMKTQDPNHLVIVDFNKLVADPATYLKSLALELSGFKAVPNVGWSEQSKTFYSGAAMYLGGRDLKIWFRDILNANGITKQESGLIGMGYQLPKELADSVKARMPVYEKALKDEVTTSQSTRLAARKAMVQQRDQLRQSSQLEDDTFDANVELGSDSTISTTRSHS